MVLDYREKRPVTKNKPRRQSIGTFALVILVTAVVAYGLGMVSGWFAHSYRMSKMAPKQPDPAALTIGAPTTPSDVKSSPAAAAPQGQETPPLTFYETLPKGGKGVIGSGINPKRADQPTAPPPAQPASAPPAPPAVAPKPIPAAPPTATKAATPPEQPKAQPKPAPVKAPVAPAHQEPQKKKGEESAKKFTVQVASYRDRKEAETIRERLAAIGHSAYIMEIKMPGKGVWFRVCTGRHLRQQDAHDLAAKIGAGALAIPE